MTDRPRISGFTLSGVDWSPPRGTLMLADGEDLPAGSVGQVAVRGLTVFFHDGQSWVGPGSKRVER